MKIWPFLIGLFAGSLLFSACSKPQNNNPPTLPTPKPNTWQQIGTKLNVNGGQTADISSIALGNDKNPIVSWTEKIIPSTFLYVARWNGSKWIQLGDRLNVNATNFAYYPSLAIDNDNNPFITWYELDGSSFNVYVKHWNGSKWIQLGNVLETDKSLDAFTPSIALDSKGHPFVALYQKDDLDFGVIVKYWDGSKWKLVGNNTVNINGYNSALNPTIAIDSNDNPVVSWNEYVEDPSTGKQQSNIYVKRWNGSNWIQLGEELDVDIKNDATGPSLTLDKNNNPIVSWQENDKENYNVYVKQWDGSSWLEIGGALDMIPAQSAYNASLAINYTDNPVISWVEKDDVSSNIYVKRWNGHTWTQLGNSLDNNLTKDARSASLALDNSGNPLVTWHEQDNTSSAFNIYVKRYIP